jgi:polygalacturonase
MPIARKSTVLALMFALAALAAAAAETGTSAPAPGAGTYNIRDYGATGLKQDSAQAAIQKAVDACAAAGGGTVLVPPGDYSTGTIFLRSHVRVFLESGATIFSIKVKSAFPKESLFYAEDAVNITLDGRGTVNGQAAYVYRPKGDHQDDFIYPNQVEMEKLGKPLTRSFPKDDQYGHLILFLRCRDVRISGLNFIDSPSWTVRMYGCVQVVIDGVYIHSSLKDGVWADGIDPDGCRDVRIANSTIETGDDALVFYSMNWFGPALPCENITVTNCRLSSASSAIKFCDGNMNAVRNVTISNCVITDSNRGVAFMNFDGGVVENVTISDLTIDCIRSDWFWWGDGEPFHFNIKKRSEVHKTAKKEDDHPAGIIRNVLLRNIVAHGRGPSICNGHPDSWLDGITLDNVKLFVAHDPAAPYDKTVNALTFKQARNLKLRNVEIFWDQPGFARWESALVLDEIQGLTLDGVEARPARPESPRVLPAVVLQQVDDAVVRNCKALPGTGVFLEVRGGKSREIVITGNDFRSAKSGLSIGRDVSPGTVRETANIRSESGERGIKRNE